MVFGHPGRAGRHYKNTKIYKNQPDLGENKPVPGAPKALSQNALAYIDDTAKYPVGYLNPEYRCFFSMPMSENESDGGNNFAVLNINSPIVNQFDSKESISEKITPALRPFTTCIKVLHKLWYT